jgi:hypothetical protein
LTRHFVRQFDEVLHQGAHVEAPLRSESTRETQRQRQQAEAGWQHQGPWPNHGFQYRTEATADGETDDRGPSPSCATASLGDSVRVAQEQHRADIDHEHHDVGRHHRRRRHPD